MYKFLLHLEDDTVPYPCSIRGTSTSYERTHSLDSCLGQFPSAQLHIQLLQRIYTRLLGNRATFLAIPIQKWGLRCFFSSEEHLC